MIFKKKYDCKKCSDEKAKLPQTTVTFLGTMVLLLMFVFSSCGDDDPTNVQTQQDVVDVIISPDSAEFSVGEQLQFSAFVLTEAGDTVATEDLDVEWEGEWWSSDPEVFTVQTNGLATGNNPGEAFCIVELDLEDDQIVVKAGFLTKKTARVPIGLDSAYVRMLN